jgi:hypothetical protein
MTSFNKISIVIIIMIILSVVTSIGRDIWKLTWWMSFSLFHYYTTSPSLPEVKTAEFSFKLEYKINGKMHVIEDIYVAEYDGIGDSYEARIRKWKGYIKTSREEDVVLLKINKDKIYYEINFPEYWMGDVENLRYHDFKPSYTVYKSGPLEKFSVVKADELLEDYGIELISWEMDDPIENTFVSKK